MKPEAKLLSKDVLEGVSPSFYRVEHQCRACGSSSLLPIVDFGETPLADRLLKPEQLSEPELFAPLRLVFCPNCSLVQIDVTVDPEILFAQDYPYFSSVSQTLLRHSRENALELIERRSLNAHSLVMEPASNDGYMLRNFVERGIPVLGIDPAKGPAKAAIEAGIPTLNTFFTRELAQDLVSQGLQADLLIANNVLAHVADLNGFIDGVATVLKESGMAVMEMPYVVDLITKDEFDTIYHQHLCYFSVTALDRLFRSHGLFLNDVRRLSIHGGSLRLYIEKVENVQPSVMELLQEERETAAQYAYFQAFAERIARIRHDLVGLLQQLKAQGKRIAGYGAAAKATTLLAYCGIGRDLIEYIADLNPYKHGRVMGGNHIPIVPAVRLDEDKPDFVLLLVWNFAEEVLQQRAAYRQSGGKFIIPIPNVRVV